jgi:hypothetical protein
MGFYVTPQGQYYEGDQQGDDEAVPPRPSSIYKWENGGWNLDHDKAIEANKAVLQSELDRKAFEKGYDNILSACSYASQPEGAPFQAEGAAFLAWRSAVWDKAFKVIAEVTAGNQPFPTPEEAVAMMPELVLP